MAGFAGVVGYSIIRLTGDKAKLDLFKCITGDFGLSFIKRFSFYKYIFGQKS